VTISLPRSLFLGLSLVLAACGGEGLTLPPDGAPAHIEVTSGNGLSARVGSALPESLVVKVTDTQNRTVANAEVVFEFTADGSVASPASARTDANGRAASQLVVGTRVGPVSGTVRVPVDAGVTPVEAAITASATSADANGIALVSGDDQTGAVGTELSAPLVVSITDRFGNPIPNAPVEWSVIGGGSVSAAATFTGADGQTSVTRTLGSTAGEQTTLATARELGVELAGSPVRFTHTATAGTATGVVKVSGDNQSGSPGAELSQLLVVQVLDGAGNPIPNRALTWTVGEGGGSVAPVNTATDAQGHASTRWTLGASVGPNTVNAVVSGLPPATFRATATAGAPSASNSTVAASPELITAGSGSSTITVTVRDGSNNPVSGASVSVASTGTGNTITPASASSGANGVATFTFSSTVAETKTITATAGGVSITDQATVTVQKTSSTTEITSDDPDPSTVGVPVSVEFTVTGPGGTPTGNVTVTISGGSESCEATLTSSAGSCSLTPLTPGTGSNNRRILTATYAGDARFSGDTDTENHRVDPLPAASTSTTITSDAPDPSDAGAAITVSFTVTSSAGTPTGNVQVTDPLGGGCNASVATGSCQYTPGGTGARTITATYGGGSGFSGSSDTEEHTVSAPSSVAPVGVNETYATPSPAGSELSVGAENGVLVNDTDADTPHDQLVVDLPLVQTTPGGTLEMDVSGTFQYTPNAGTTTTDTFQYQARDPEGNLSNVVTVTITITP
jgi:hypothetical protein